MLKHAGADVTVRQRGLQRLGPVPGDRRGPIKIGVFIFTNAKDTNPEPTYSGNWKTLKNRELALASVNGGGTRRRKADERKPVVHGTTGQTLMRGGAFVTSPAPKA